MEEDKSQFDKECLEALAALGKTVLQLGLYGGEHPSVFETLKSAESSIGAALKTSPQGTLVYAKDQDKWLANGRVIGFIRQVGGPISSLIDRYKLSSVTLRAGLTTEELIAICRLSSLGLDQKVDPQKYLVENKVSNIVFNEAVYADVGPDGKPTGKGGGPGSGEGGSGAGAGDGGDGASGEGGLRQQLEGKTLEASINILIKKVARSPEEERELFRLIMEQLHRDIEKNVAEATQVIRKEKVVVEFERARTENILENVGAGGIVVDEQGNILLMNPAAEEIYGAKLVEVAGKPLSSRSDAKRVVALAAEIEASSDKPLNKDIEVRGPDDTKRIIRSSWAIVKNQGGRVVGMVLALTDLAAHKKAEKLEEEFIARMTHELRSPLASVEAGLDLLKRGLKDTLTDNQKTIFAACETNTNRQRALINSILDFSKLESGMMTFRAKVADPAKLGAQAVESLAPLAAQKGISLTYSAQPGLPEVFVDPEHTVQVLINLVSNALKFTPKKGTVAVSVVSLPSDAGRFATYAVRDNGRGISPADQARVFEKFVQVESSANAGGTGLGLPIAKSMVELQGGRLWLESAEGRGSAFYFTVPVRAAETGPAPAPRVAEAPKPWWKKMLGLGVIAAALLSISPARATDRNEEAVRAFAAARDKSAASQGADSEAAFMAGNNYAAALFRTKRFLEAAKAFHQLESSKSVAASPTYRAMVETGQFLSYLNAKKPKEALEHFVRAHAIAEVKPFYSEKPEMLAYLTTIWAVKKSRDGELVMGEIYRPACTYDRTVFYDEESRSTYATHRLGIDDRGLMTPPQKLAGKTPKTGKSRVAELPAILNSF